MQSKSGTLRQSFQHAPTIPKTYNGRISEGGLDGGGSSAGGGSGNIGNNVGEDIRRGSGDNVVAGDEDLQGLQDEVEELEDNLFKTDLVSVPWASMDVIPNLIRELNDSYCNYTVVENSQYGNDQRARKNIAIIHRSDTPADGNAGYLIISEPDLG